MNFPFFELDNKWNDYVGAQKEIISKLKKEDYFERDEIINVETGMHIRISPKGIKETIGKGKRFQNLPKIVKMQKVATIRSLPILIREGELMEDDVPNYYLNTGDKFAYLISKIRIDDEIHDVRIAIKKKISSNHFYIHHIDTQKSSELLSPSQETDNYEIQNFD